MSVLTLISSSNSSAASLAFLPPLTATSGLRLLDMSRNVACSMISPRVGTDGSPSPLGESTTHDTKNTLGE